MSLGTGRIRSSATTPPPPPTTLAARPARQNAGTRATAPKPAGGGVLAADEREPRPFGIKGRSDVGDPQAGMRLVPAVDGHEVRGQRLDLAAVAQPSRVDSAHAGDPPRQRLYQVGGVPVVAEH